MKNVGAILPILVSIIAGTYLSWKKYRKNQITKKSFVTTTAIVIILSAVGCILLTL
ncbi:hypothetical protein [Mucilaginibacter sp. KACC 22063]|uniref:hypothetical protein n=1 Tax=Mucilaginibacter sp. KACC 22063 TaxID=3025666 RepID=UPI00236726B5|nr:hypothetical protein [Mucilaginibacter sp. KACC 22063]WDF53516.1 hypothetical protein PQ461_11225 [Mucilaginibacter sp. KACC 22063]